MMAGNSAAPAPALADAGLPTSNASATTPQQGALTSIPDPDLPLDEEQCTLCLGVLLKLAGDIDGEKHPNDQDPPTRLAAKRNVKWDSSNPITISFLNGEPELKQKVMGYARLWTQPGGANLTLTQIADNDKSGDIRIRFKSNGKWWSHMGTESRYDAEHWDRRGAAAKKDNPERASMNLDLENVTDEAKIRRHVIHEFGHALGFIHEHLRSDFPYILDREVAKNYYRGWSWKIIEHNVLNTVPASPNVQLLGSKPDLGSIMIYPFPPGLLKGGPEVKRNTELSRWDIKYAGQAYPKPSIS